VPDAVERTLVLVKPDGVARGLIGEVLGRIERRGLVLVAAELRLLDRATAELHYGEHLGKPFFDPLIDFITSGPLLAAVAEGPRAVETWRRHRPGQGAARHDPRRLWAGSRPEPRARVGFGRFGRSRDRAVLPRTPRLTDLSTFDFG
jgi:nucleoside diphosphate kinase